jgi:hypothetical protein
LGLVPELLAGVELEVGAELWVGLGAALTGADLGAGGVTLVVECVLPVLLPSTVVVRVVVVLVLVDPLLAVTLCTQVVECQDEECWAPATGCGALA